jgi:hypothetical protein
MPKDSGRRERRNGTVRAKLEVKSWWTDTEEVLSPREGKVYGSKS